MNLRNRILLVEVTSLIVGAALIFLLGIMLFAAVSMVQLLFGK